MQSLHSLVCRLVSQRHDRTKAILQSILRMEVSLSFFQGTLIQLPSLRKQHKKCRRSSENNDMWGIVGRWKVKVRCTSVLFLWIFQKVLNIFKNATRLPRMPVDFDILTRLKINWHFVIMVRTLDERLPEAGFHHSTIWIGAFMCTVGTS